MAAVLQAISARRAARYGAYGQSWLSFIPALIGVAQQTGQVNPTVAPLPQVPVDTTPWGLIAVGLGAVALGGVYLASRE